MSRLQQAVRRLPNAAFPAILGACACIVACGSGGNGRPAGGADGGSGGSQTLNDGGISPGTGGRTSGTGGADPASGGRSGGSGGSTSAGGSGGSIASDSGTAGASGSGGSGGGGAMPSGLPVPPGPADLPVPDGTEANLSVMPWAGFAAAVTYTFDDSSPSQVDHYPAIENAGVPVTLFLTTTNTWYAGYEETWKAALADGHELGNHTVHHCAFDDGCNGAAPGSGQAEVDDATAYITQTLGQSAVWTMAYPFGDLGYRALAEQRFFLARGVAGGEIAPDATADAFNLPAYGAVGGESEAVLSGVIDGVRSRGNWVIFLFHSLAPNGEAWYAPVDVASVTGSMEHAKTLADVWIDTMANVGAYWVGKRLVEEAQAQTSSSGTTWTWSLPDHFPPDRFVRVRIDGGTLSQGGRPLTWDGHGYYEVALDAGSVTWTP